MSSQSHAKRSSRATSDSRNLAAVFPAGGLGAGWLVARVALESYAGVITENVLLVVTRGDEHDVCRVVERFESMRQAHR